MGNKTMLNHAFTLTAGNIISRFLGLIYVFPFAYLVGSQGQALYSYAYVPYIIFIDLATLGVPLGVSKFISLYNAQNDYATSYKIYKKATYLMLGIGFLMFLIMFFLSRPIAYQVLGGKSQLINNVNDVTLVIRVISLALLIVPSIALLRGFLQGFKVAYQPAMSQIIEQLIRVSIIVGASFIIIKVLKYDYKYAILFSVFAASIAAVAAYIYLRIYLHKFNGKLIPLVQNSVKCNDKSTVELFKELFKYAIPIAMFGLVTSLYSFIDTLTFNKAYLIKGATDSEIIYGTYAFEINKLIMIPVSLGMGLGVSLLIYITEAYTKRQFSVMNKQITKALQTCCFIIMPIVIMMMVFPRAVYSLFYQADNAYGPSILLSYAPVAILLCINHIINASMQGINRLRYLMISMTLGVCLKLLYNEFFIVKFGFNGAILATSIALLVTIIINMIPLVKNFQFQHLFIVRRLLVIFSLNILIGLFLYLINFGIMDIQLDFSSRMNCLLFLIINTFLYVSSYLSISYFTGLLDVIYGKTFQMKNLMVMFWDKYVNIF